MEGLKNQSLLKKLLLLLLSTLSAQQALAEIEFDSSLLPNERRIIRSDLQVVSQLKSDSIVLGDFQNRSKALQAMKQKPNEWMLQRIKVLVGPLNRSGFLNSSNRALMRNLGAVLTGTESQLANISVNGRKIEVRGPDVGVVQFLKDPSQIVINSTKPADALVNSIYRIGLLFHDARHSDGSAQSRGIPHMACPPKHLYQGQILCDGYVDGSFATEILIGEALLAQFREKLDEADQKLLASWIKTRKRHIVGSEIYGD